ncbi:MAG: alpha-galactosidase [Planctomycetes bacterium]|nr:alpha-galactosidase [Planctomycetota bacterium]
MAMIAMAALAAAWLAGFATSSEGDWLVASSPAQSRIETHGRELVLDNGLLRRVLVLEPAVATVSMVCVRSGESFLRAVQPEARLTIDGREIVVGGLVGQRNHAFITEADLKAMEAPPGAAKLVATRLGPIRERFPWKRVRHVAPDAVWPPKGASVELDFRAEALPDARITLCYELYDGLPLLSKSLRVQNAGKTPMRVDRFVLEELALVETESRVDPARTPTVPYNLHVETDYAFHAMTAGDASSHAVRFVEDPQYSTQVNYERKTRCLLEVGPPLGPAAEVAAGATFESFRVYELAHDSTDRERRGLAVRRAYRTLAPWATENPLMMHVRTAESGAVRQAIDQCAEVGFEMAILSFGSGFDAETEDADELARIRELHHYARSKKIELGGYSLLSSRRISDADDVVNPKTGKPGGFAVFGDAPCLGSPWGVRYFSKLRTLFGDGGLDVLEHDGSYPGDPCASDKHPGHRGLDDSQWQQHAAISAFYRECRARGVYLNVPDWYFLQGSSKNGMGYRESNWSLPRAQQILHTRQNIYDGTWEKTPSMGWMFVPLTEYQGGGAAATIEPLDEHREHYDRMLMGNLAFGVQACYRGPRLYDTERVRDLVRRRVEWYRTYRDLLESDLIHGRRADGREIDWMLHVNPRLETKAMLVAFNPREEAVRQTLRIDLYYSGIRGKAQMSAEGAPWKDVGPLAATTAEIPVEIAAGGFTWVLLR